MYYENDLSLLVGKTLKSVWSTGEEMLFACTDGYVFRAYHVQNCCAVVAINDITGDLQSLVGHTIVVASEEINYQWPDDVPAQSTESFTWTTHRFRTDSGVEVVVRWLGVSNGYYGEDVRFDRTHKPQEKRDE